MYQNNNGNPTPIAGNLSDILDSGAGDEQQIITHIAHNMGNRTFVFTLPMKVFYERSVVANERGKSGELFAQRPLNQEHANKLAKFMLKGLVHAAQFKRELDNKAPLSELKELEKILGKQPYVSMQPIVCNLRDIDPKLGNLRGERILSSNTQETVGFKVWLPQNHLLYVVDGQHRRKAMQILFEFLNNAISSHVLTVKNNLLSPLKGQQEPGIITALQEVLNVANAFATVQIECHLGLDIDQERQLFHDLNNLGKKVEASLALQFDNSNPVNVFLKEVLIEDDSVLNWPIVEKDVTDWHKDGGEISRKDLVGINARLFLNKTNISGATSIQVNSKIDDATAFWKAIASIPYLGVPGAKLNSVAAQPVILRALAKLAYDFKFGKKANNEHFQKLLDGIPKINYSHNNPMWRFYQLTPQELIDFQLTGLKEFLPSDDEGYNRDIGHFDEHAKTMRFGAKSNDIFPILGDMIRWSLGLPNRQKDTVSTENPRLFSN